ncbi:hypothetical protein GCM10009850_039150 [Nonomuraea monospora]|uniref:Uncharacterized protein n=1 Tax=Nonomuraea monospora TaxID=568818 RepID=A0ABN3CI23_9ACTN
MGSGGVHVRPGVQGPDVADAVTLADAVILAVLGGPPGVQGLERGGERFELGGRARRQPERAAGGVARAGTADDARPGSRAFRLVKPHAAAGSDRSAVPRPRGLCA